jgi:2-keto-3-deoxy-galactonokinase
MAASEPYNGDMTGYSCIAVDWGSTNRRAWALGPDGRTRAERSDAAGLLSRAG